MIDLDQENVLVTGAYGFLGGHLVDALTARDMHIHAPSPGDYDLRDPDHVREMLREHRPTVVFHLAARCGGIGANQQTPATFFLDNMRMGLNVLDECAHAKLRKVVMVGTVCSYPKHCPTPFRESDLWNGYPEETNAAYGVAKRALITAAEAYRAEHGLNAITVLPANLYGPRDHFELETSHVIPAMVRKFEEARIAGASTVTLWGDGSPTREFLYVEDAARGLILAAENYDEPVPMNLGNGKEVAIRDLAVMVAEATGYAGTIEWDGMRPNGQPRRCLDTSSASLFLDFGTRVSLADGLRRTVEWYRSNPIRS